MRTALVFLYRNDDSGSREEPFKITRDRVSEMYPFDHVLVADDRSYVRFNRSATRNLGVLMAESYGAEKVVLCDADSIPEERALRDAIQSEDYLLHFPFNEVWEMSPKAIHNIAGGSNLSQLRNRAICRAGPSQGGIWVCRPDVWWLAGGQDSRLRGWGCEDRAMINAAHTLVGQPVFHPGVLMCLYHDRADPTGKLTLDWEPEDVEILHRYNAAYLNREATLELINERADHTGTFQRQAEERCRTLRQFQRYDDGIDRTGDCL